MKYVACIRENGVSWKLIRQARQEKWNIPLDLAITVSADVLAPNSARPSASTELTEKLDMFSFRFLWLPMIPYHL